MNQREMCEYLLERLKKEAGITDKTQGLKTVEIITEEILMALYNEGVREDSGTRLFWYAIQAEINKQINKPI